MSDEEGEYLVEGSGMSLYLFKADRRGTNGASTLTRFSALPGLMSGASLPGDMQLS